LEFDMRLNDSIGALIGLVTVLGMTTSFGQAPRPQERTGVQSQPAVFEVASIKPNVDTTLTLSGITAISNGQLSAKAMTVRQLVSGAYRTQGREIIGGPEWTDTERYDIEARAANGADEAQLRFMLQALLVDRFRVRLHSEAREGRVYALVVGPSGPRLKPASGGDCPSPITMVGRIFGKCGSAAQLAEALSRVLDRPVVDRTELTASFSDVRLEWVPDETQFADWGRGVYAKPVSDPSGPSVFTAVQEQLGLRLESTRAPIEVIVLDAAERPTAN
jgi:uncharacterized protein (TIGR03435 family)